MSRKTLIVTNDFPPRQGGIQSFVHELAVRQPAGSVVVYCSDFDGSADFDRAQPFPIIRHDSKMLLPTRLARERVTATLREYDCTAVWFGASAPLGLLAGALRTAGAERIVATTHGHEVGWARFPACRQALRRIGDSCDVITYLGEYTRARLVGALGPRAQLRQLTPGVDDQVFNPSVSGLLVRVRYGLTHRPVIVCVSRLVPRKGQDRLIDALVLVRQHIPDAALLLVGKGRHHDDLIARAARRGVAEHVVLTGGVPYDELPAHYAAGDVFAMPCRTRRGGLDVEGLGMVFLEASAVGLPVVVGDSGGASDAVIDKDTGYLVDGRDTEAIAARLVEVLSDEQLRKRLGASGRAWVHQKWRWEGIARTLTDLLNA